MMLMDTCAIVWDALEPKRLSARGKRAINTADEHNALIISDISIWEIAMLISKGRIEIATTASSFINLFMQTRNVSVVSISPEIVELSANFGNEISSDPADRIIVATAIVNDAQLVTADKNLVNSELIDVVW